jgi:hypothetical protein
MAKSPEKPTPAGGLETDSLPWQPSPGPLAAEDPAEGFDHPQEAIGGGSHQPVDEAAGAPASRAPEAAEAATTAITEGLKDLIVAQPLKAVGIAAMIGFLAAALFRR